MLQTIQIKIYKSYMSHNGHNKQNGLGENEGVKVRNNKDRK